MRVLFGTTCIGGVPAVLFLALALAGWANVWPVVIAAGLTLLAALALALVWEHDRTILIDSIRQVAPQEGTFLPEVSGELALTGRLGREIERLARRVATHAALVEQLRRADTLILERLPDPLIVLAADRTVCRANAAARAAFGDDMPAVLRNPAMRGAIDRAVSQKTEQTAALSLPVPVARELHVVVVPMDPPLADGGRFVIVLSDRTREHAVERMRADFVANVSHELRTPLASLIGFIETLRGPAADDPPAQQKFLGIMAEQGARMHRLIDDLLSLSRIEIMEHQAPSEAVDLSVLLPSLVRGYEPRLAQRDSKIRLELDPDLPPVTADADQLAQVLNNLLDNAVKYGRERGTVRLHAGLPPAGSRFPSRPGVVVAVTDEGPGIPRAHLSRLTERFYRVDKGRSRAVGGTGLGLAIVKHIVNRHRGQLLIESEEGVGTTVSVWLPLTQALAKVIGEQ